LYYVTYHPRHHCWLFTQPNPEPGSVPQTPAVETDDVFYRHLAAELRRTARQASANQSVWWFPYRLPDPPQPVTPGDLAKEFSASGDLQSAVRFTREGGWQAGPSVN
jgi:hypothetical protein